MVVRVLKTLKIEGTVKSHSLPGVANPLMVRVSQQSGKMGES